jgi:hypothetical protein
MYLLKKHSPKALRVLLSIMLTAILGIAGLHPARALAQEAADQEPADQTTDAQDASSAAPQAAPTLTWSKKTDPFDTGIQSFVAMNSSGFIVEVHSSEQFFTTGLYYHLGKLNMQDGTVQWGPSRRFSSGGAWPAVAITDTGTVIITRSDAGYNCCSYLDYWVGTVNPNGNVQQEISFKQSQVEFDRGFHNGLAVTSSGIIIEVHESGNGGKGIYYRLGYVATTWQITWLTGSNGQKYDEGVDPRIAVDGNKNVVEVHGVANESLIHYIRGTLGSNSISFNSEKPRLSSNGARPSVAMRQNSYLIETESNLLDAFYRTGSLSSNAARVVWTDRANIYPGVNPHGTNTSVAANASWAIVTNEYSKSLYYATAKLP